MSDKVDIIIGAYSQMRISGLTVIPSVRDNELALTRLEGMAAEFYGRNIDTGYFFEDEPDPNTPHNMEKKFWYSYEVLLALRLCPDFGKPTESLIKAAGGAASFLASATALVRPVAPSTRMPRGSGNTRRYGNRWWKFYGPTVQAPLSATSITMAVDDTNDFVEHFDAYLRDGEDVDSYTIEADDGLTINSDSLTTPDIDYQILADTVGVFQVKIVATTSDSRIETRIINFTVLDTDVID